MRAALVLGTAAAALWAGMAGAAPSVTLTPVLDGFNVSMSVDAPVSSVTCTAWRTPLEVVPTAGDIENRTRLSNPYDAFARTSGYVSGGGTDLVLYGLPSNVTYGVFCAARAVSDDSVAVANATGTTDGAVGTATSHNSLRMYTHVYPSNRVFRGTDLATQPAAAVGWYYYTEDGVSLVVDTTQQHSVIEIQYRFENGTLQDDRIFTANTTNGVAQFSGMPSSDRLEVTNMVWSGRNYAPARFTEYATPADVTSSNGPLAASGYTTARADRAGHVWLHDADDQVARSPLVAVSGSNISYEFSSAPHTLFNSRYGNGDTWQASSASCWIKIDLREAKEFAAILFGRDSGLSPPYYDDHGPGAFRVLVAENDAAFADGNEADDATEYELLFESPGSFSGRWPGNRRRLRVDFPSQMKRFVKLEMAGVGGEAPILDDIELFASFRTTAYTSFTTICAPEEGTVREATLNLTACSASADSIVIVFEDYHLLRDPLSSAFAARTINTIPYSGFECPLAGEMDEWARWRREISDGCDATYTHTSNLTRTLELCQHEVVAGPAGSTEYRFSLTHLNTVNSSAQVGTNFGIGVRVPAGGEAGDYIVFEFDVEPYDNGPIGGGPSGPGGPPGGPPGGGATTESSSPTVSTSAAVGISFGSLILLLVIIMTAIYVRRRIAQNRAEAAAAAAAEAKAKGTTTGAGAKPAAATGAKAGAEGDMEMALAPKGGLPSSQPASPRV